MYPQNFVKEEPNWAPKISTSKLSHLQKKDFGALVPGSRDQRRNLS